VILDCEDNQAISISSGGEARGWCVESSKAAAKGKSTSPHRCPKGNNLLLLSVSLLLVIKRLGLPVSKEEHHGSRLTPRNVNSDWVDPDLIPGS
jgi:hypothetical protein